MKRRHLLLAAAPTLPAMAHASPDQAPRLERIGDALQALQALSPQARGRGAWSLAQVFEHAAQSVEYSMQGFPSPKSALFQATVGRAAFALFSLRGRMSHSLSEPIPGAPALAPDLPLPAALDRLQRALKTFDAWRGPLRPHFAYGALDKADYTRAHLMHLADHWSDIDNRRQG